MWSWLRKTLNKSNLLGNISTLPDDHSAGLQAFQPAQ